MVQKREWANVQLFLCKVLIKLDSIREPALGFVLTRKMDELHSTKIIWLIYRLIENCLFCTSK